MKTHRIGDMEISKLTLGTVQLGLDYSINSRQPDRAQSLNILNCAINAGIRVLDTARDYGQSEEVIGAFLKDNPNALVVSKFKLDPADFPGPRSAFEAARRSVQLSLENLGLTKIPILLFHKDPQHALAGVREVVPGILKQLKALNLIDMGGISVVSPEEIEAFLHDEAMSVFQVPVNLFDHRLVHSGLLTQLQASGKIVFARSIFLKGLFFKKAATLKGQLEEAIPYLLKLQQLSKTYDLDIADLAFSFVRDIPGISSLIFGADHPEQVAQNARLLNCPELSAALRAEITEAFSCVPEKVITPHLWEF